MRNSVVKPWKVLPGSSREDHPVAFLRLNSTSTTIPAFMITGMSGDGTSDDSGGTAIYMTHNASGNRQVCFGATENVGSAGAAVFRFLCGGGIANIDGVTGNAGARCPMNLATDTSSVSVGNNFLAYNATLPGKLSIYGEASVVSLNINHGSSGTADLTRWCNNSGTLQSIVDSTGSILCKVATAMLGYGTGAGGTVTQITSKATGVTLNKASGAITMNAAALAADTTVSFVLTNSSIAAGDVLILNHISGGTPGSYLLNARSAAGSATIDVRNITTGSLSEAIVIQFAIIKAVSA